MKNGKTTIGGILAAAGAGMASLHGWPGMLGQVLCVVGPLLLGASAKDLNVTGGTVPQ